METYIRLHGFTSHKTEFVNIFSFPLRNSLAGPIWPRVSITGLHTRIGGEMYS
jgi:hypothetical protein